MVKYSIIIPAYNLEKYINKTIDSIAVDGAEEKEIIVINDGSTDRTLELLEECKGKCATKELNKCKLSIISQINGGVSKARNTGIENASGEYIIFVDGDDIFDVGILDMISSNSTDSDVIVWQYDTDDFGKIKHSQQAFKHDRYKETNFLVSLLSNENRVRIGSFAIKKSIIDDNKIRFTEGCAIGEDIEFIYKSIISADSIVAINKVGYTYIKRKGSAINTMDMRTFEACYAVKRAYEYAQISGKPHILANEYIIDNLKNGLLVTHCMYGFENCISYIMTKHERKEIWAKYSENYGDIEQELKDIRKNMKYPPKVFSTKRLKVFMYSRKLYLYLRSR